MSFNRIAAPAVLVALVGLSGLALSGCGSTRAALGMTKVVPDEFAVVTKAPLVVPPDYALRPPSPGEPRPQELEPESLARIALLNQRAGEQRSEGERILVAKAGADKADPMIRVVIDDEFGSLAHKEPGFADRVMFWRRGRPETQGAVLTAQQAGADTPAPIDPTVEATRVRKLTANQPVVIQREQAAHIKLPGL
jgi:Protein of unknown function (DUF3035)